MLFKLPEEELLCLPFSVGLSVCLWKKSQNGGLVIICQGVRLSYNVHKKKEEEEEEEDEKV